MCSSDLQTRRFHDLFAGGTGLAVGDVLGHRAAEQIYSEKEEKLYESGFIIQGRGFFERIF